MCLDVVKVGSRVERWVIPVQVSEPSMNVGVAGPDVAEIAFEVTVVDRIEAYDSNIESDVRFRELVAHEVLFTFEDGLDFIERFEKNLYSCLIGCLCCRESGFVDAI